MPPPPLPRRGPRRPAERDRTPARIAAVAGVATLLLVFAVSVSLVVGGGEDGDAVRAGPAATSPSERRPTPTRTPTPTPEPTPTPVPMTAAERAEREAAAAVVGSRGFEVMRLRDWDPRDTLRVLIGRSGTGGRLAFFFVNGDYIGNDSTETSAGLRVRRTGDLATTLRYRTYADGDDPLEPTGDRFDVRFTWDGARLTPDRPLPPIEARSPAARAG